MGIDISIGAIRPGADSKELRTLPSEKTVAGPIGGPEPERDPGRGDIEKTASEVQIFLKRLNTELRFEVDSESREVIVRIIDPETGEVIRQVPSEELLAIRKRMEDLIGVLYDARS